MGLTTSQFAQVNAPITNFLKDPAGAITGGGFGGIGGHFQPASPDLSGLQTAQNRAFGVQGRMGQLANNYQGEFNPYMAQVNLGSLQSAAAGTTPSAAELQLRQQAGANAANSYGLAAALQGRNPGAAMNAALRSSQQTQADTNNQAAILRANEQAQARNALTQALQGYRAQDINQQGNYLQGEVGALNAGTNAAVGYGNALANEAAAQNQYKGSLLQGGGAGIGAIFSDRRGKKDIKPANLLRLAKSLKGYDFRYKDEANGEGRRVGVMAQDVAKGGPAGRAIVRHGSDGKMRLDAGNAIGAALAMSAAALKAAKAA